MKYSRIKEGSFEKIIYRNFTIFSNQLFFSEKYASLFLKITGKTVLIHLYIAKLNILHNHGNHSIINKIVIKYKNVNKQEFPVCYILKEKGYKPFQIK